MGSPFLRDTGYVVYTIYGEINCIHCEQNNPGNQLAPLWNWKPTHCRKLFQCWLLSLRKLKERRPRWGQSTPADVLVKAMQGGSLVRVHGSISKEPAPTTSYGCTRRRDITIVEGKATSHVTVRRNSHHQGNNHHCSSHHTPTSRCRETGDLLCDGPITGGRRYGS